jgi:hypothetical protein
LLKLVNKLDTHNIFSKVEKRKENERKNGWAVLWP